MEAKQADMEVRAELVGLLKPHFPGITVEISHSKRWGRMCVTFRWPGFAELLPEERFHRLTQVIPESIRKTKLAGFVWLELAAREGVVAFLKLPRSEDVAARESGVYGALIDAGFFQALKKQLGRSPEKKCGGGFEETVAVLKEKRFTPARIRDAKLIFIRHGVFCDCQILQNAMPELARLHAGAA